MHGLGGAVRADPARAVKSRNAPPSQNIECCLPPRAWRTSALGRVCHARVRPVLASSPPCSSLRPRFRSQAVAVGVRDGAVRPGAQASAKRARDLETCEVEPHGVTLQQSPRDQGERRARYAVGRSTGANAVLLCTAPSTRSTKRWASTAPKSKVFRVQRGCDV